MKKSTTWSEDVDSMITTISKKKKTAPKRSIRENFGMASKATLTSAPRKSVLNESNDMVARMQKLANISKIK